jgi:hypothetical protein
MTPIEKAIIKVLARHGELEMHSVAYELTRRQLHGPNASRFLRFLVCRLPWKEFRAAVKGLMDAGLVTQTFRYDTFLALTPEGQVEADLFDPADYLMDIHATS